MHMLIFKYQLLCEIAKSGILECSKGHTQGDVKMPEGPLNVFVSRWWNNRPNQKVAAMVGRSVIRQIRVEWDHATELKLDCPLLVYVKENIIEMHSLAS